MAIPTGPTLLQNIFGKPSLFGTFGTLDVLETQLCFLNMDAVFSMQYLDGVFYPIQLIPRIYNVIMHFCIHRES